MKQIKRRYGAVRRSFESFGVGRGGVSSSTFVAEKTLSRKAITVF